MARKKTKLLTAIQPSYYAYYDGKTGSILCVTNEQSQDYEYGIEISAEEADKLISGEWNFKDYLIGHQKQANGITVKCIIPSTDQEYAFRNNLFEWITENESDCDFIVDWKLKDECWRFSLKNKEEYLHEIVIPRFVFFVTLQDDLDFLIRTIIVDTTDIMNKDHIDIPFESSRELDIKLISISTRAIFNSYRLRVNYE